MQNLLSLLPALACPLGMGLMMWLMMRMVKEQKPSDAAERRRAVTPQPAPLSSEPSPLKTIWDCMQMCLNWKVLTGLAVVAVLIGVIAPHFFWRAIPLVLVLICPLSMIVMISSMSRRRATSGSSTVSCLECSPTATEPRQELERPDRERFPDSFSPS